MKFLAFLAVVLLSGAIAGTVQGMANLVLVEPVLDKAIYLENKALFDSGAEQDSIEFRVAHEAKRLSCSAPGNQIVSLFSSAILGMSMGSLVQDLDLYCGIAPDKINGQKCQKFQVKVKNLQYDAGRVIARVDTLNQMRLLPV